MKNREWPRAIIFDLDGTLLDSSSEGLRRFCIVAEKFGLPVDNAMKERINALWGKPVYELVHGCWPEQDDRAFLAEWRQLDLEMPHSLFPGVKEMLATLRKNDVFLYILTNRDTETTTIQLEAHTLTHFFDYVCAREASSYPKPHRESVAPILNYLKARGIAQAKTLMVGDHVIDFQCAQNANFSFIVVLSSGSDPGDFDGLDPSRILPSVVDLLEYFCFPR